MDIFKPIQVVANFVTYRLLGLTPHSYLGDSVNFFIDDVLKIGLMLVVINYMMAITRYYFPLEKIRDVLAKRKWCGLDYLLAALFGVITPFCSCSSIPLFIGFLSSGIPLGVTFAFLIASPLVNEASLALFPALFGLKITVIYNLLGIVVAVLGGLIIQKLKLEKYVEPSLLKFKSRKDIEVENGGLSLSKIELIKYWWNDGMLITKKIFPYVLLGVGIGGLIHGFLPADFFEKYLTTKAWWSVPLASLLGVPLYANSVSVIPIMEALVGKGAPLGTALAFMTATVTLSIPEALILNKAMKWPLLVVFFSITIIGISLIGFVFNFIRV